MEAAQRPIATDPAGAVSPYRGTAAMFKRPASRNRGSREPPVEARVEAAKRLVVLVDHGYLLTRARQSERKLGADTATSDDDDVHDKKCPVGGNRGATFAALETR